eukprot:jgi/Botrbrau1/14755/Bobra.0103s0005.1
MCDDHLPTAQQALQQREEVPKADEFRTKSEQFLGHYCLIFRGMTADRMGVCDAYERLTMRRQAVLQPSDVEKKAVPDLQAHVHALLDCCRQLHGWQTEVVERGDPDERCPEILSKIDRLLWDLYYSTESRLRQFLRGAISVFLGSKSWEAILIMLKLTLQTITINENKQDLGKGCVVV